MIYIVAIILLLVLGIWGISQGIQNYAMVKQAEATAETAKAAQVASFGNVIIILVMAIIVLGLIAAVMYGAIFLAKRKAALTRATYGPRVPRSLNPELPAPGPDLNQLTQLVTLQMLMKLSGTDVRQLEDHDER